MNEEERAYELMKRFENQMESEGCDFVKVEHKSDIHGNYVELVAVKRYK